MSISLENPKQFLPLLLFIGFVFVLLGSGQSISNNNNLPINGFLIMTVAVILWIMTHRSRF